MPVKKIAKKPFKKNPQKTGKSGNKTKTKKKVPASVIKYLEKAGVSHEILEHKTVYTAIDAAATMKKKLNEIAKSLLVKADKDYYLVLLPADYNLDFNKLAGCIGVQTGRKIKVIKIPGEKIMESALKIKTGALTAFGKLHKVRTVVEKKLGKTKEAVFASGSPNHSILMKVKDFINIEEAFTGVFGKKKKVVKQKTTKPKKKLARKK